MYFYQRQRTPLIWRMLKTAAAGWAIYRMVRTPDAAGREQRRVMTSRERLKANAERALAMKMRGPKPWRPESRTADEGMHSTPNRDIAPSGALDAEGFRPAFERSHRAR
jgi:hypothetical protein